MHDRIIIYEVVEGVAALESVASLVDAEAADLIVGLCRIHCRLNQFVLIISGLEFVLLLGNELRGLEQFGAGHRCLICAKRLLHYTWVSIWCW